MYGRSSPQSWKSVTVTETCHLSEFYSTRSMLYCLEFWKVRNQNVHYLWREHWRFSHNWRTERTATGRTGYRRGQYLWETDADPTCRFPAMSWARFSPRSPNCACAGACSPRLFRLKLNLISYAMNVQQTNKRHALLGSSSTNCNRFHILKNIPFVALIHVCIGMPHIL